MNYEVCEYKSIIEYKKSIFETILVEDGHPYFLDEHLLRLEKAGLEVLGLSLSIDKIKLFIYKCLPKIGGFALRVVCNINSCILSLRVVEYKGSGFLKISSFIRDSNDIKYRYKTSDYSERLQELADVQKLGFLDAVYLNENSFVTSCSIANVFFIKKGKLFTPAIETGVLNGIVREIVLENSECIEGEFNLSDFLASDGIFITNSVIGIIKVTGLNDQVVACDEKIFNQISNKYRMRMDFDRRKCCG
ncbi:MAG: 4-amino-4-deoxychorismate lyase [Fusobacteria bacterium]|nr:MAG: 4-amino-4-deoxychorismate lyase [Fusobacteriota bacterium]KAF0229792.1 MAG: 4-amino-4-deoxychorismate [Fusobacteriota bacterium]